MAGNKKHGGDQLGVRKMPNASERARNRASPLPVVRLYDHLSAGQRKTIEDMDLGTMLDIKCHVLHNPLINWLAHTYDNHSREFVITGRGRIPLNTDSIYRTLGLPRGDISIVYAMDAGIEACLGPLLFQGHSSTPTIIGVFTMLSEMTQDDDIFKQVWMMYLVCTLLAPTTSNKVSTDDNISNVRNMNICQFVCDRLHEELCTGKPSGGCLFHVQLLYVDSLDISSVNLYLQDGPFVVNIWSKKDVDTVLDADLKRDGSGYGNLERQDKFARLMGEFSSGITGLMSKLVQGWSEVEDNEHVDTAKTADRVCAEIGVCPLSDAGGAANTMSPKAQATDGRPAQILRKSPIRRLKNVPCNQNAEATNFGGSGTAAPSNVLDSISSPITGEQTNVVADVPVVEQTRVTRSAAKAASAANVLGQVDKVPVVNFSDNMSDVESYHSANDSDYVDESVSDRFVVQSRRPVDVREQADIMVSECAVVPSQTTFSGVGTDVPGVSPAMGCSAVAMHIDGAVAEPSEADATIRVMEVDSTIPPSGEVLSSSFAGAVTNEDNGSGFSDGYDAASATINDVVNQLKRSSPAFDASKAKRSCVAGEDHSVNPQQNVPSCPPKKKSNVATRSSPRRPRRGIPSVVPDNIVVKAKGSLLKDRLQGSTKILGARTSTVVATGSQISVDGGSDEVALKDVVVPFKSTSQIVATENGSPHEEPFEASFAPLDFGTNVTNQTADTVGQFAGNASAGIGTTVDVAPDVEQNATTVSVDIVTNIPVDVVSGSATDGNFVPKIDEGTSSDRGFAVTDDVELLYITPALPVPVHHLSVTSRTPRTKLHMARVVLPSKFMLPPYNRVASTDEQDNLYQQVIKHNNESESSKIKDSRFLLIEPMWVSTGDLASSVMPSGELSSTVAEIGIAVLQVDCPKKKIIFP
ncbi:hypothetical protein ACQ4PT_009056 [Festuca glaucescens]